LSPEPFFLVQPQICTKSFSGRDFTPDLTGGAHSTPPDPLARKEEGKGGKGEGKWGKMKERKGREV